MEGGIAVTITMGKTKKQISRVISDIEMIDAHCEQDVCYWACDIPPGKRGIKLQGGEYYTLIGREYMKGPVQSRCRRKAVMKGTGLGFSEGVGILPTLHGMRYGRYPRGVLYLFPTDKNVQEFSQSRFSSLIQNNPDLLGRYVKKVGGKGVDTTHLKRIGDSFLYLRGATLNPEDEGSGAGSTSGNVFGIQVDRVVFDELMLMNQEVILKALMRMGDSNIGEEVYIANAGGQDETIDMIMKQTDQRFWWRKCGCGAWTCAEKSFPQCVKLYDDADERARTGRHRGYVGCDKCGKPVPVFNGWSNNEWVADQSSVKDFEGYNLSHLASSKLINDPASILEDYENPPQGNLGDVIRLRLGQAYSSSEDKLQLHAVLANCGNESMPERHEGPCVMGVDVGIIKHVVIGFRTGAERWELIRLAEVGSFNDIHDLARRYNVKTTVVDIRPYEDEARAWQRSERAYGNRVWLCQYNDSPLVDADFNDRNGVVKVFRTGIFDKTHHYLTDGYIRLPRRNPTVERFAQQCCNCSKHKEESRYGGFVYRYRATGDGNDHYRNALNYFILVARGGRIISRGYRNAKILDANNSYVRI